MDASEDVGQHAGSAAQEQLPSSSPVTVGEGKTTAGAPKYCVTGANGYLASWLVMLLLERGYHVRGTVRDPKKTGHLTSLFGAAERLELVQADLMDEASLAAAVQGCDGVFAVATPITDPARDQAPLVELTITSMLNLLRACCSSSSVKRVLLTSSYFAAKQVPHDNMSTLVVDETCWASVEYCKEKLPAWGYMVAKTLSERAAFQFAKENGLDLVSILPSLVAGSFITSEVPISFTFCWNAMTDAVPEWAAPLLENSSYVHVDDCMRAHILLMEDPHAKGRYICSACDATFLDVQREAIPILESYNLGKPKMDLATKCHSEKMLYKLNISKLKDLGFAYKFDKLDQILRETASCMLDKDFVSKALP